MASGFCSQPETHTAVFPIKGKICRLGVQVSCQREPVFTGHRANAAATRSPGRTWKSLTLRWWLGPACPLLSAKTLTAG